MKRQFKKDQKVTKGMPSAVVLSILIHVGLFLLAGMLVVFTVVKKEEKKFVPPKAVERPKMKLRKPKVKVKKSTKPKATTRIVTKVRRASMPDIQLPEMSGLGGGLAGGLGGFDLMPDLGETSVFGSGQSIGNDFEGTFYDFKRDRNGRPIPYSPEEYRDVVRKFIKSGWKTSTLARYYQSPKKLYATTFVIPPVLSEVAPAAFGEKDTEGNFWMVLSKGQLVHKDGITFRFIGSGDEILVVRVDGKIVMGVAWEGVESEILGDIWRSSSADSKKYWMGNQTAVVGDWVTLEPGVPLDMEVIMTDNGGQACLMLAIEEKEVEYEKRMMGGGPTFPAFKTAEPSHDLLDAIYQNLVSGEVSLTNGPVFCDYALQKREPSKVLEKIAPSSASPSPESARRVWTSLGGKTMEAGLLSVIGDKAVLDMGRGKQKKVPLAQLSEEDREYIELANPPAFDIDFSGQTTQVFSIRNGSASGETVAYDYLAKARLKQKSAGAYNHELHVEFFAIGREIHGNRFVLLDRQESRFTPSKENHRSHSFSGKSVELPDFTLEGIHRGNKPYGYLVVVMDRRGEIIEHSATGKWLFENLGNLRKLPVGAYMDESCVRVFPTGPKRTRY